MHSTTITIPAHTASEPHEAWLTVLGFARFLLVLSALWLPLFVMNRLLPNLKPGHMLVFQEKERLLRTSQLLDPSKRTRVLIFGNSQVLAGFQTLVFEAQVPDSSAFNLGLPNSQTYVPELTMALEHGERPTHVLLTIPWETAGPLAPSAWNAVPNDNSVLRTLFPFRDFIHDAVVFAERGRRAGGVRRSIKRPIPCCLR